MSKERYNQLIDEVYETYTNHPLATIQDHHTNILYQNLYKGWCILIGRSIVSPHPTRHLTKEEFVHKCKTDREFSEWWGLKLCYCGNTVDMSNPDCVMFSLCEEHKMDA
jgi:hypothetical protein